MQTESLTIRISKPAVAALRKRARREGVSVGSLIRRNLCAGGLTPEPQDKPAKCGYDLVKHLAGICRGGPKDLATNPKYFEGFGR